MKKAGGNRMSLFNATFKTTMGLFIVTMLYYVVTMLYYMPVQFLNKE